MQVLAASQSCILTFSVQHFGDVQIFLSYLECCVQVSNGVVLYKHNTKKETEKKEQFKHSHCTNLHQEDVHKRRRKRNEKERRRERESTFLSLE